MCGICGFINDRGYCKRDLEDMNNYLSHRGPDDEGYYIDHRIGLAQKRLSILDLSSLGKQPMSNENCDVWITFNGEIYNFHEIKEQLIEKGYKFKTNTDTEVIIYSYEEWGMECLNKFIGMYAFAIWDAKMNKLILARDRLGIKPLYYYHYKNDFVFASELKPILKYPNFKKAINNQSITLYFTFGYIPAPYSIYENVYKVPPGSYLIVDSEKIDIVKYWDAVSIKKNVDNNVVLTEEEYVDELQRLLRSSIKYRLISDVPIGAFLSGGIDSSVVVSIMNELSDKKIKTFSIGFRDKELNEANHSKAIANYLGTEHIELYIEDKDLFSLLNDMVYYYDEPFFDSSSIPTMLVSKLARESVTVALSGDGGDELFCGYKTYNHIKRLSYFHNFPSGVRKIVGTLGGLYNKKIQRVLDYDQQVSDMVLNLINTFSQKDIRDIVLNYQELDRSIDFFNTYNQLEKENILDRAMICDIKTYLVDDILTKLDRASMKYGLEARVPILDHRIVEFAFKTPMNMKVRGNDNKYLLKKVLHKYIPCELTDRPKKGFSVPLKEWVNGPLNEEIEYFLSKQYISKQNIFNYNVIIRKKLNGEFDHKHLWSLYIFQKWYDNYFNN